MRVGWKAKRRLRLWRRQNGRCWWCNCYTILPEDVEGPLTPKPPLHMATLDHLDPRGSPMRGRMKGRRERIVMACWECNQRRGQENARLCNEVHNREQWRTA